VSVLASLIVWRLRGQFKLVDFHAFAVAGATFYLNGRCPDNRNGLTRPDSCRLVVFDSSEGFRISEFMASKTMATGLFDTSHTR
jgi:hypothetical protein